MNPSDVGIYDRVVIQELIKTVASAQQLNAEGQKEFKVRIRLPIHVEMSHNVY